MLSKINTNRLGLSLITMDDAEAVFHSLNHENTARSISFLNWPMTIEQAESLCRSAVSGAIAQTDYFYLARINDQVIGGIGLHPQKDFPSIAETGYWVDEFHQGNGYASEMLGAIIRLAFDSMEIQEIYATTSLDNSGSARVLIKSGFVADGQKHVILPDKTLRASNIYKLYRE